MKPGPRAPIRHAPLAAALTCLSLLAGCAANAPPVYQAERFDATSSFARHYVDTPERLCDAARRALLSQGYLISDPSGSRGSSLTGRKSFQPRDENHVQIDLTVSCVGYGRADRGATAFVSALQERYALKKSSTSASVGVGPVGNISLPFGSSSEAMVKIASETITSPAFYDRFFALLQHYLADLDERRLPEPIGLPEAAADPQGGSAPKGSAGRRGEPETPEPKRGG